MTTETTEAKTRTITLTGRAPVKIVEDNWPIIAHGHWLDHDNQYESQANRRWRIDIRVRQHADGRAIVYGVYDYDTAFQGEACEVHRVGSLLNAGADLPAAIKAEGKALIDRIIDEVLHRHVCDSVDACIADLPAEVLG